jgi:GSCFA family
MGGAPASELSSRPWDKDLPGLLKYEMAGKQRAASASWYRGESCNFHPFRDSLSEPNAIADYVGLGWFPDAAFITKEAPITTFGSCFAVHVTKYLAERGYNVADRGRAMSSYVIKCGEGMVNTAAIAQQFQWAYGETEFDETLWYDAKGDPAEYSEAIRRETREIFDRTDVFIITLGLSEVWHNKKTGAVFWRAIPVDSFDPTVHGFKILNVDENKRYLGEAYKLIREHRGGAPIIFTLSPVPLAATFRPISCITANAISKAILRVAVDEFMRENESDPNLYYFPAYELVKEFFQEPFMEDLRHVRPEVVAQVMDTFGRHYLLAG